MSRGNQAHGQRLLRPACPEPAYHNTRTTAMRSQSTATREWPLLAATRESPHAAAKCHAAKNKERNKTLKKHHENITTNYGRIFVVVVIFGRSMTF